MKYVIGVLLILLSSASFSAVSRQEAQAIYNRIVAANGMWIYPHLKFSDDPTINAHSGQQNITVNQGTLNATNVDELAFVLGHELAHSKLFHTGSTHKNEYAADKLGYFYASKAGYNMCNGVKLFKKFPQRATDTHPSPKDRVDRLPRC